MQGREIGREEEIDKERMETRRGVEMEVEKWREKHLKCTGGKE